MKHPNDGPESFGNQNRGEVRDDANQPTTKKHIDDDSAHPIDNLSPFSWYDMRYMFASDDVHERFTKRHRRQSESMEVRN